MNGVLGASSCLLRWFFDDNRKGIDQLWARFTSAEPPPLTDPAFRALPEAERAAYPAYAKTYSEYFATHLDAAETGDITWGQLSWRAVVPLYIRGYTREASSKLVAIQYDSIVGTCSQVP